MQPAGMTHELSKLQEYRLRDSNDGERTLSRSWPLSLQDQAALGMHARGESAGCDVAPEQASRSCWYVMAAWWRYTESGGLISRSGMNSAALGARATSACVDELLLDDIPAHKPTNYIPRCSLMR